MKNNNPPVQWGRRVADNVSPAPVNPNRRIDSYHSYEDILQDVRKDFISADEMESLEDVLEALKNRDPDEVPDFPANYVHPDVMKAFAEYAIEASYKRAGRDIPDTDDDPPYGSDGGRVVTAEGVVSGYGWEDDNGKINRIVSKDGQYITVGED